MADRHALVVGIDAYSGGIPPLGSARKDAEALAGALTSQHGYEVELLVDGDATAASVTDFLTKQIPGRLTTDTPFLVYFAGHGVAENDDSGSGPQGYLILQDGVLAKPETWLPMDTFRKALNDLACRHLLVVLDCCYAGAFRWATATRDIGLAGSPVLYKSVYDRYMEGEAWQALTSASASQRAADAVANLPNLRTVNADGHSPFAAALINGLAGAADYATADIAADGVITATELYQYISSCLLPAPDAPATQTPGIWPLKPANVGEYVFLNPKVKLKIEPDPELDPLNNPWLGLEAYTAERTDLFFGRADETAELVRRAEQPRATGSLLALVGASGAGKSSLIQAGLVPALGDASWVVVQCARLADDPNGALAAAVEQLDHAPKDRRGALVIDQFTELFTQSPDPDARAKFMKTLRALVDGNGGPLVVVALRSDFELRAAEDESLASIWQDVRYQVPPVTGDELRQVILGPAQVKTVYFEPAKVADDLFDEVSQTPGALPLLSFALSELYRQAWERRQRTGEADRELRTEDYDAIGGVVGALNKRATDIYASAAPDEQEAIRRIFLRLVDQEGAGLTSRRVRLAELQFGNGDDAEQQAIDAVKQRYADAGLLVLDGDFVEPCHDALIVQWQELHDWIKASPQDLIRAAWSAASAWETHDKKPGYLWNNDPRLPQLTAANRDGELNSTERDFETASTNRRKARRRRLAATVFAVVAVLAAATVIALLQRNQAIQQRNAATSVLLARDAETQLQSHPDIALAVALAAYRDSPTVPAESSVISALEAAMSSAVGGVMPGGQQGVTSVAFSPNGKVLATGGRDGTIVLWDTSSHRQLSLLKSRFDTSAILSVAFSRNGELAAGAANGTTQLWNISTRTEVGRPLAPPPFGEPHHITSIRFSPSGQVLAALGTGTVLRGTGPKVNGGQVDSPVAVGSLTVWNLVTHKPFRRLHAPQGGHVADFAFSPNGHTLATAEGGHRTIALWAVHPGMKLEARLRSPIGKTEAVAFTPGGHELFVGGLRGRIGLVNTMTGSVKSGSLPGHSGTITAFLVKGGELAIAEGPAGKVVLAKTKWSRQAAHPLGGNEGNIESIALSPNGRILAAATGDGAVLFWNTHPRSALLGPRSVSNAVAFSPDGRVVATGTRVAGQVALWNASTGTPMRLLRAKRLHQIIGNLAFSPDGNTVVASGCNQCGNATNFVAVWNLRAGRERLLLTPSSCGFAFSADGSTLATCSRDGVQLLKTATDKPIGKLCCSTQGFCCEAGNVAFSSDGIIAVGEGSRVQLANGHTGAAIGPLLPGGPGQDPINDIAFSPDGHTLAAAGYTGLSFWNVQTRSLLGPTLEAGQSNVWQISFSPDGRTLAAATNNGIFLWDVGTRTELGRRPSTFAGSSVAFSPEGAVYASAGAGPVQLWRGLLWKNTPELEQRICSLLWGTVDKADWIQAAPSVAYEQPCSR